MLLAHQGVEHEDTVYTMEGSATWFEDHKLNMGLDFPNLPYYVDGDLKLTQSMAILRHLGREHGLYGKDNKETSQIDMIMDFAGDMRLGLARLAYNPDFVSNLGSYFSRHSNLKKSSFQENQKAKHIESMEPKFKQLSAFLEGKQFLMGDALTIADFTMHDAIAWHQKLDEEMVKKFPNVVEYLERFRSQPKIKTFLEGDKAFELMFSPAATWNGK